MQDANFALDTARVIFASLDRGIYLLISVIYKIIIEISQISLFSGGDIEEFTKRIYIFIGVFMLFKVTFSLISYLVDPDKINDKTSGIGNVAKNVVVTLFLIIIVPYGFDLLYEAQNAILKDNLIPRLILGTNGEGNNSEGQTVFIDPRVCNADADYHAIIKNDEDNVGDLIAILSFRPFYQFYDDYIEDIQDTSGNINKEDKKYNDELIKKYCQANNMSSLLSYGIYNDETGNLNSGQYYINYQFLLSTITGAFIFLLLLNFAFDIAARTVKLGFLEIIAPIPILSYIDPKSSKDGAFKKWLSEVGKTWASLFIRLAILYFAIYMIKIVSDRMQHITSENGIWITLFLIIGVLIFAKNAVPLIENIFGIKIDQTVQLNPFKKISDQALGGKALVSAPGKILSAGVGAGVAAGGLIVGNRKKSKDFQQKSDNLQNAFDNLSRVNANKAAAEAQYNKANAKVKKIEDDLNTNGPRPLTQKEAAILKRAEKAKSTVDRLSTEASEAQVNVNKAQAEFDKSQETTGKFSYQHPVAASMIQAVRGAKLGLDQKDTNNIINAVVKGIDAAKQSTKMRNDYDKFGLLDRMRDLGTDLTGVKNESGTTSQIKGEMKKLSENLTDIENAIKSLEHSFGNLSPGATIIDASGHRTINNNYPYSPGEKEGIQTMIDNYDELRKAQKDGNKQMKEFEEIIAINSKKE